MVKVIEIFEDGEFDDDEDVVIFDRTTCGERMLAEWGVRPVSPKYVNNHKSKRYW